MNESDKHELAETLATVLDEHRGVNSETHEKHHEYIEVAIQKTMETRIFWAGVRKQVFGWGIIVMLSGIGYAVADYARHVLHLR